MIHILWLKTFLYDASLTGEKSNAGINMPMNNKTKAYVINPAVKKVNLRTPCGPKYSLIKSVTMNTIGHGSMPKLKVKPYTSINFPPIISATTAFVMKIPAKIK